MRYVLLFLEGIITFVSPCILPMIPVYVSYFMGAEGNDGMNKNKNTLCNALAFVAGFSIIFTMLGAAAGTVGVFFNNNMRIINLISGALMIVFGLHFMEFVKIGILNRTYKLKMQVNTEHMNLLSTFLFGVVFGIGWTPCVGPFLGSALMIATNTNHVGESVLMLLVYSLGLGIPFLLSTVLIHYISGAFELIKQHYRVVKIISGILLILVGILMATGYLNKFLGLLTF